MKLPCPGRRLAARITLSFFIITAAGRRSLQQPEKEDMISTLIYIVVRPESMKRGGNQNNVRNEMGKIEQKLSRRGKVVTR